MLIEDLRRTIDKLSGSEAKSLLLNTLLQINQVKDSSESQEQKMNQLTAWCNHVASINHHKKQFDREYEAVHIVSGESPAGTLRVGLGHKNLVIGFPEFFAVGPIWMLDKEEGREQRYEWLKDHINIPEDYMEEEYKNRVAKALEQINAIPEHLPCLDKWTAA